MNLSFSLLLVDDDSLIADSLRLIFPRHWKITAIQSLSQLPQEGFFHAAFVDLHLTQDLRKAEGPDVIREIKTRFPKTEVISISGDLNLEQMEKCLEAGAGKFLAKPLLADEVKATIDKLEALWQLREIEQRPGPQKTYWVGSSPISENLKSDIARLRGEKGPILIEGETGTGKEVVAKLLHQQEPGRPFIPVNISAIPENLFESELFGHAKGAFTGADSMKIGLTEAAQGGDLFLDEIEALPLTQQVKLLRFLESGEIRRVGAKDSLHVQVRVIAATNQNLEQLVREGQFREDLLYRLKAHKLLLPPLRNRKTEIEELVKFFLAKERPRSNKMMSPEAFHTLQNYTWPGNVRELKRVCEQLTLTSPLPLIRAIDVTNLLGHAQMSDGNPPISEELDLNTMMQRYESMIIRKFLSKNEGVDAAAEKLKISRSSLYKKMKDYGIEG